jgi:putative ABC transport system substrate-binding protein
MRKTVIGFTLSTLLFALSLPAESQQPKKIPLIGYLSSNVPGRASDSTRIETIRLALRERGYIEGQNIAFEYRYAEDRRFRSEEPAPVDLLRQRLCE